MLSTLKKIIGGQSIEVATIPTPKSYNLELLKKSIAYNAASLHEIISLFIQQKPLELQYLEEAVTTRNLTDLARRAHSLKGNLNLFGMQETYDQLVWIEKYAKENTQWDKHIDLNWKQVKRSFENVLNEIPQELAFLAV